MGQTRDSLQGKNREVEIVLLQGCPLQVGKSLSILPQLTQAMYDTTLRSQCLVLTVSCPILVAFIDVCHKHFRLGFKIGI